jgi:hypothetical protein
VLSDGPLNSSDHSSLPMTGAVTLAEACAAHAIKTPAAMADKANFPFPLLLVLFVDFTVSPLYYIATKCGALRWVSRPGVKPCAALCQLLPGELVAGSPGAWSACWKKWAQEYLRCGAVLRTEKVS